MLVLLDEEGEDGLDMNQRIARKPTRATARIWGMLIVECEASAMVAAICPSGRGSSVSVGTEIRWSMVLSNALSRKKQRDG